MIDLLLDGVLTVSGDFNCNGVSDVASAVVVEGGAAIDVTFDVDAKTGPEGTPVELQLSVRDLDGDGCDDLSVSAFDGSTRSWSTLHDLYGGTAGTVVDGPSLLPPDPKFGEDTHIELRWDEGSAVSTTEGQADAASRIIATTEVRTTVCFKPPVGTYLCVICVSTLNPDGSRRQPFCILTHPH